MIAMLSFVEASGGAPVLGIADWRDATVGEVDFEVL
jgi:hypothetical protein